MNNSKTQGSALVVIIVILSLLIVGTLGYVVWNSLSHTSTGSSQQTDPNDSENPSTKEDITVTLPNGKIATYPDTKGNSNITFRDADNGESATPVVFISHKGYDTYLASLGKNKVDELCGTDDNLKAIKTDIVYGLLNTSDKTITPPQNQSCVDLIASGENSDVTLRAAAQEMLDTIAEDVNAFIVSVTIK